MSPWMRLDDGAPTNIKIQKLSDSAFRLWIKGLCYCQQHLTDGAIPTEALGPMEAKRKDIDQLCTSLAPGKGPLWEVTDDGYAVHDYLDWNDSREDVTSKREAAKARAKRHRTNGVSHTPPNASRNALHHAHVLSGESGISSLRKETASISEKPMSGTDSQVVADRAANLLEKYRELYAKHRHGARFRRPLGNLEWLEAVEICNTWDDDTLHKLIEILLTTDDEWVSKTDRAWKVFNARVQWCADRLAAWEASNRRSA